MFWFESWDCSGLCSSFNIIRPDQVTIKGSSSIFVIRSVEKNYKEKTKDMHKVLPNYYCFEIVNSFINVDKVFKSKISYEETLFICVIDFNLERLVVRFQ